MAMEALVLNDPVAEAEAGRRCLENLLNCYCREVATPDGDLTFGSRFGHNDWPLALRCMQQDDLVMHLLLPRTASRVIGMVERASASGCYRYRMPFYYRAPGRGWSLLEWRTLAHLLLQELALKLDSPVNQELYGQIENSVATLTSILTHRQRAQRETDAPGQYLASEQGLVFGHAFHPTPKSREGFSDQDLRHFSPELGAQFPLHYFAVEDGYVYQSGLPGITPSEVIRTHAAPHLSKDTRTLVPVHPWQARMLRQLPVVRHALRTGQLEDLGPQGDAYAATSSIRTLFHPENPYFYKVSLQVRITNCVRKNAFYELEGALEVSRLLQDLEPGYRQTFPGLRLLFEPGFITVDLPDADPADRITVQEGFGLILRDGVQGMITGGLTPVLAGALFAAQETGEPTARSLCAGIARRDGLPFEEVCQEWLATYAELLLHPMLHAFFIDGVVFEPHLQNVLVGLRNGWPVSVAIRDFEGVKLVQGRFPVGRLGAITQRAQEALWYDMERGWNRIAYCLFVNQLCEVIAHLSGSSAELETRLWDVVRQSLVDYQLRHGCRRSDTAIRGLLGGAALPAKCNLLNRVHKRPDRAACYAPFPNPLLQEVL